MYKILALSLCTLPAATALAAPRTVTLYLPTMDCPVCPITVKNALRRVDGVSKADVNFGKRQAMVSYDDTKTSVPTLTRATQDAGYPSTAVGQPQ
ncbi:MAG: hypothetical protein RLY71_4349 [Pseudomonadota bacterium]|jgi:mercuric ion binding protein